MNPECEEVDDFLFYISSTFSSMKTSDIVWWLALLITNQEQVPFQHDVILLVEGQLALREILNG